MIIVTGATGQLGRGIAERLLERLPAGAFGVSVRDPAQAAWLSERGVRVRRGDFEDPASLRDAFAGASQVLIVSAATTGEAALAQHRTAISAAREAGAERILYTSHMGASPASAFAPMLDHAITERELEASGIAFTALRNGFYAATILRLMSRAPETGELAAPEDGPVSWTAHADLAEAAAIVLTDDGELDGLTQPLTGAEALDLADVAALASEVTGHEIRRVTVSDGAFRDGLVGHGVPAAQADMLVGMFVASRAGEFAAVDPALERLLGRPPVSVRDVLGAGLGR